MPRYYRTTTANLERMELQEVDWFVLSRLQDAPRASELAKLGNFSGRELEASLLRLTQAKVLRYDPESDKLPPKVLSRIDAYSEALESADHYALLQITPSAQRKEIRDAYFRLSKSFHPDRYFGVELGPYKSRLERIFSRLTHAYETLSHGEKRKEYDLYLQTSGALESWQSIAFGDAANEHKETESPNSSQAERSTQQASRRKKISVEEKKAQARKLMNRRLGRKTQNQFRSKHQAPPSNASHSSRERHLGLVRTLRQVNASGTATPVSMTSMLATAKKQYKENDLASALSTIRCLLALHDAPEEVKDLNKRWTEEFNAELIPQLLKNARYETRSEMWEKASDSWTQIAKIQKDPVHALSEAARASLMAKSNLMRARDQVRQALSIGGESAVLYRLLAKVYIAAGMEASARDATNQAKKLDR